MKPFKAISILAALFLVFLFSKDITYSNSKVEFPESNTGESLWIGAKKKIINVSASNGSRLLEVPVKHLEDIAADNYRGVVWAGTRKDVIQYTLKGREILRYPLKIKHEKNEEGSDDEDNAERLVHISLDPSDGSLWIGAKDEVIKLSHDGRELFKISTDHIVDVSVDISDGSCWVGLKDKAVKYTSDGEPVLVFNLEKWNRIHALATDPYSHSLWIGAKKGLIRIDRNGLEEFRSAEPHYIQDLKIDLTDGSLWLVTKKEVFKYSSYGYRLFSLRPCIENDKGDEEDDDKHKKRKDDNNGAKSHEDDYDDDCDNHEDDDHCEGNLITLAVDPSDSTCWIAWRKTVLKLSAAGEALLRLNGFKQIEALDIGLPELRIDITDPLEGAAVNTPSITVKGTVTDRTARVTVNGITAPVTGNVFEAHDLPLTPGVNTITATAVNIYGNSVSDSITVTYEPPLAIQIRLPSDGSVLPAPYTDVFGTVSDPSAYVEVNGLAASVVGNSFEVRKVPLNIGVNTITATAADIYGNSVSDSITVTYEPPPLTIKILSPSDSSAFSSSRIDVTGTISDPEAKVSVNGIEAIVSEDTFTAKDIPLTLGENIVTAIAMDEYGRTASDTIRVNYTWLNISITYPGNGETFSDTPIDVFGTVSDPGAYVDINGKEAVVSADGSFTAHGVKLSPGENQITAQATNAAGQTDDDTVEVVYDPPLAPLSLNLLSPENGSIMEIPYFKVTGVVTDPNATVLVNDTIAQVDEDGFYTASIYACEPPETPEAGPPQSWVCTVTVSAYSNNGQVVTANLTYTYFLSDNPLTVRITEPSSNRIVTYSPYEIQGELNDVLSAVATARITVNGITPAAYGVGENSFSVSIALNDGLNYITVRATNAVGHDAFDTIKIIYDLPERPLGISIYSPLDRAIVNYSPITVFGGATHSAAEVDVNGIYADFNKDFRSFKAVSVPLSPGENLITATAWIPSEETAIDSRIVIYDPDYPSPPAPVLSELPEYSSGSTEVSGLTIPSYKTEIFANGTSRAVTTADSNGLFKTTLYLPDEGANHISARAIDIHGNKSSLSNEAVVIRDTIRPILIKGVFSIERLSLTTSWVLLTAQTEPFAEVDINIDYDTDYKYHVTADEQGKFFISINLCAGQHYLYFLMTDKAGNKGSDIELAAVHNVGGDFTSDTNRPIPPQIDPIPTPLNEGSITVEGNAYSYSLIEVYRNNELMGTVSTDNRGRFRLDGVTLLPGRNIIEVRQKEGALGRGTYYLFLDPAESSEVVVDVISGIPTRPNVKIDFPVNGSITDAEFLPLRGTIDTSGVTLRVNGYYDYTGYATAANGRFASNQKIPLLPGENTLWVEATSPDGSRGVDKITVYSKKDAQAPSVNITNPAEGEEVYDQLITTSGSAGDAVQKVIVNESEAAFGNGTFETVIDILSNYVYNPYGYERMITAWAMDANGNIGHHDIPFRYKYIPVPTLSITSPLNGEISGSSPITVTGSVQNASEVTVNGVSALIDKYKFTANIDLKEGQNTITVIAKNTVKASVIQRYVTYTPGTTITLQSVTIEPSPIGVPLGDTRRLRAIGTYSNGDRVDLTGECIWTSAEPYIASVNNGIVKGVFMYEYNNSTTVTASYGGFTGAATVFVILPEVKSIMIVYESPGGYLSDNPVIILGEPFQFKAYALYTDGSLADISTWGISWASSNTAVAAIDGGGVITAKSKGTTEITATLGSLSATRTLTVFLPVYVFITSPVEGGTINNSEAMVKGIMINSSGNETGVVVNGIVATLYGNKFTANNIPLTEGQNTITAIATDGDGNTDRHSITVNAVTTGNYIRLTSNIESGIAPLEATLRIDGSFSINESSIGVTGPAQPEFLSSSPDEYQLKFIAEGVYYITVSSTDPDGNTYQDTIAITVMNKTELDALLKAKWEGMKGALIAGDIDKALTYFVEGSIERYRQAFTDVGSARVNSILSGVTELRYNTVYGPVAQYWALRTESDGTFAYPLTFFQDANGIWKIMGF